MEDRNTPKVRIFTWKACNGIVPTCQNLGKRIKNARVERVICGWELETDRHIFFDCERAKSVWKEIGREQILKNVSVNSFRDWLEYIMETHSKAEVEYLVIIIWMIWKNRNGLIFGRKDWKPEQIKTCAHGLISDFQTYQLKLPDHSTTNQQRWYALDENHLKINVDGAFTEDGARIGMVVRDHKGQVEAVMVEFIPQSFDSEHVETLAFLKALQFARDFGISHFETEGDALNVVHRLNDKHDELSICGHLISGIKSMFCEFQSVRVGYVKTGPVTKLHMQQQS